ncbi:MAG: hypothetical protein HQL41_14795 [Alphaproteobacteria bacterium]|nr:hypothetical protein [Alphaproteobacteria bacterium]
MAATCIFYDRMDYEDGAILEMIIWIVPRPVHGSAHAFKYSLFYGYPGRRLVGYDNERGKGDHRHFQDVEERYAFTTPEKVVADFLSDVSQARGES